MQLVLRRLPRTLLHVHAPAIPKKLPAFGAALFAVLTLVSALPPSDPTVRVAGTIGLGFKVSSADRMVVDSSRHRGYYLVRSPVPTRRIFDLKGLRVLSHKPLTLPDGRWPSTRSVTTFPTSPFLVARYRHTGILLRAPPSVV